MKEIKVLDHGYVRRVSYTQPDNHSPDDVDWNGDLEVVRNARVSYDAEWRTGEDEDKDAKLIRYLMRNRHTSPFEAMVFTFEVKCPLFVARQWMRHRTFSYNEVSARYTELPEEMYVPAPRSIGVQSKDNKQVRTIRHDMSDDEIAEAEYMARVARETNEAAFRQYKYLLDKGVPRELARGVLPLNTYTRFFCTVDLHNLFHFIELRIHAHAQWEIQRYAEALLQLVEPVCPVSVAAFKELLGL